MREQKLQVCRDNLQQIQMRLHILR